MKTYTVTFGGWYQRTTLHLSEVHGLMESGYSKLPLRNDRLAELHRNLRLKSVERKADNFEYIEAFTDDEIMIHYFEDGLYILSCTTSDVEHGRKLLENYFQDVFEPAIAYIFSLGAPTPKVLANTKSTHPIVVTVHVGHAEKYIFDEKLFGKAYQTLVSNRSTVFKTNEYIVIAAAKKDKSIEELVYSHIFFREFKDQLEKYLYIHRTIWEEISHIKERKEIRGNEVEEERSKLDAYQKTVDLITNRINQMGSYSKTRASIARQYDIERDLAELFQYRFEVLEDTLSYIKDIWSMTDKYLKTAIQNVVEIKNLSASRNIVSLQVITTAGVVAAMYGHLSRTEVPAITGIGVLYFAMLLSLTWLINFGVMKFYAKRKYKVGIAEEVKI